MLCNIHAKTKFNDTTFTHGNVLLLFRFFSQPNRFIEIKANMHRDYYRSVMF